MLLRRAPGDPEDLHLGPNPFPLATTLQDQSFTGDALGTSRTQSTTACSRNADEKLDLAVIVPVRDEESNIGPLIEEIDAALAPEPRAEILFVDDGSRDATLDRLREAAKRHPRLRVLTHRESTGQSRAIRTGILAARGHYVVTIDGDGQNDPADIPKLVGLLRDAHSRGEPVGMVAGQRIGRKDTWLKRQSSRIANAVNRRLLHHDALDTGCGLKVIDRNCFLHLPYFDHMHRFLPPLVLREGYRVLYAPVGHRPRVRGRSKYGLFDRLWVGIIDIFGVRWLLARARRSEVEEIDL